MIWKKISSDYVTRHQFFTARRDKCEMSNGHLVPAYYVVELPDAVCAVALTQNNEIIFVNQYRYPVDAISIELPGGFIDDEEDPETAIRRELLEETGYEFSKFEYLGKLAANPGVLNNFTHFYLATGGIRVANQQLDEYEEIELNLLRIETAKQYLAEHKIIQSLHVSCLYYAFEKLPPQ